MNKIHPEVISVNISNGGIPKKKVERASVGEMGLEGDGHDHDKHVRPHRAVLIQDNELLDDLVKEGYPVQPGTLGENLTVKGLKVQELEPGTRLRLSNGPVLELTEARRPCFVLDPIHPKLKDALVGRGGMLARVIENGEVFEGQSIEVEPAKTPPPA